MTYTQKDNELHTDVSRKQLIRLINCLCVLFQVVIKYVPYVGDSKRAMDEYTSEIMMGGTNTIALHNTCEVSVSVTHVTEKGKSSLLDHFQCESSNCTNCRLNTTFRAILLYLTAVVEEEAQLTVNPS